MTPLMFEHALIERARADRRHIVLPEGQDDRILRAAEQLLRRGVVDLTAPRCRARRPRPGAALGLDLPGGRSSTRRPRALARAVRRGLRRAAQAQGRRPPTRRSTRWRDVSYFGTMMVHQGLADGMVSGAVHTTAHTIRPAFEFIKTAPGVAVVSTSSSCACADRVLVYGDCAVIPDPDAEQLADIAIPAARHRGAVRHRAAGGDALLLDRGVGLGRRRRQGARGDRAGPRARARTCRSTARSSTTPPSTRPSRATKLPGQPRSPGRATVFVFPDLNTGNNTYKAVQRTAGAVAIGPVLQGLRQAGQRPVARRAGARHRQHRRDHRDPGAEPGEPTVSGDPGPRPQRRVVVAEVPAARLVRPVETRRRAGRADRRGGRAARAPTAAAPSRDRRGAASPTTARRSTRCSPRSSAPAG